MPDRNAVDIDRKTEGFTSEELEILDKARKIVAATEVDVSGLEAGISRSEGIWYVAYQTPGWKGIGGGGWALLFAYPSGEFMTMGREQ